jgi:hypothetical protein
MNIKYRDKRICIITNYRTGSSSFITIISDLNKNPSMGEYFAKVSYGGKGFTIDKAFRNLLSMPRYLVKVMPDHLRYNMELLTNVITNSDRIIYLYRRDFVSQVNSFLAAKSTNSYSVTGYKELDQSPESSIVKVPVLSTEFIQEATDLLKNNYITMSECYKLFPGDIYCLEDFENQNPYKKQIIWSQELPYIQPYDVEGLFKK